MISTTRLADAFVELADTLVADFDLVDFMQSLTDHAAEVSGADGVGLVLLDARGTLRFVAASNESGRALELFQLQNDEGPCLDCVRTKIPIVNADLDKAADQWPQFAPAAAASGFRSVHAFPMRLRDDVIGALNLFARERTLFAPDEVRIVQSLADIATIAILQERSIHRAEALTEQLQGALNSRILVEQAKGVLAQTQGISVDQAFSRLREQARRERRKLVDVARALLDELEH